MLMIFFRALVLYLVVVLFIRLMGKRQIGQLQPFELVITLMVADLVATPMQDIGVPIIEGIIPMFALFAIHSLISVLMLKIAPLRLLFCGKPSVLIERGIVHEKELRALNISLPELLEELRANGVCDVCDVYRAMLETNGAISILLNKDAQPVSARDAGKKVEPTTLQMTAVADGKIDHRNLGILGIDAADLRASLSAMGVNRVKDVFMALCDEEGTIWLQRRGAKVIETGRVRVSK